MSARTAPPLVIETEAVDAGRDEVITAPWPRLGDGELDDTAANELGLDQPGEFVAVAIGHRGP